MPEILLEEKRSIATITLNTPQDQNRLTPDSMEEMWRLCKTLADSAKINVVILTGAGAEFFSAGLLNPSIRGKMSKNEVIDFVFLANKVFDELAALPQITIAAINGNIMAGAVELALACDIRLVAATATLSMPEASWGGFPGAGAPHRLGMAIGHARTLEIICTGRKLSASEMENYGLVQHIHPDPKIKEAAIEMATTIAEKGPLATRGAKKIVRERLLPGFVEARSLSDKLRTELEWSEDVAEGLRAHQEKRKPKFQGR